MTPSVSVLIAVYNGQPYVESAIRSIMEQSLRDIEIIVVDDASKDDTPEVLAKLAQEDERIRIETLTQQTRLPGALNRGLELVRAPLVARMDADDLSLPDRLSLQKTYMDQNPDVVLCAGSIDQIDGEDQFLRRSRRERDAFACQWLSRFHMPLVHPTFMFRASAGLRYSPEWTVSEDYDFTARALEIGDVVSLADTLIKYRVHGSSITSTKWNTQLVEAKDIAERVQTAQLPESICRALEPLNAAFLAREERPVAEIFEGLRVMLSHDQKMSPQHTKWARRQAAQLAVRALQRSGRGSKIDLARAFTLGGGYDFAVPLLARICEIKGLIPSRVVQSSG